MSVKEMAYGMPKNHYDRFGGEVDTISVDNITVPDGMRSLNDNKVKEIYESIAHHGLIQPIGVRQEDVGLTLVYGGHRYAAWMRRLREAEATGDKDQIGRWLYIPAVKYSKHMADDDMELLMIRENLERAELTAEQRKTQAGRVGKLMAGKPKAQPKKKGVGRTKSWFCQWYENANIQKRTAEEWWKKYREESGLNKAPGKATKAEQESFFEWLETQEETKAEGDKKTAEELAKKQAEEKRTKAFDAVKKAIVAAKEAGVSDTEIVEFIDEVYP